MTIDEFRAIALALPNAIEGAHSGHPDFRVAKRVFATLGYPTDGWAMVKLTPGQQALAVAAHPKALKPANGAWGKKGSTLAQLSALTARAAEGLIRQAWENLASR